MFLVRKGLCKTARRVYNASVLETRLRFTPMITRLCKPFFSSPATLLCCLLGTLLGAGGFTFREAEGLSYLGNASETCANCHIMREHYAGWQKASHHAVATCNDCHTPHGLVRKLMTKADNGFWHSKGFTLQDFPEPIRIRRHNRQVLNRNCQECHHDLVNEVVAAHAHDETRFDCIRCHVASGHGPER